jgi:hypothetical protein
MYGRNMNIIDLQDQVGLWNNFIHTETLEISLWGILIALLCFGSGETREHLVIGIVCVHV